LWPAPETVSHIHTHKIIIGKTDRQYTQQQQQQQLCRFIKKFHTQELSVRNSSCTAIFLLTLKQKMERESVNDGKQMPSSTTEAFSTTNGGQRS
jgi:hypothetical protein